ncbi:MAG TPA: Na+-transporting NADH:ubiquinone oxidoreductase subunit D [Marinilabiliales bacterium]|nr:Na+-transporting NADH:ubiquinone oxidoreductase subunit D [Marinilabiliales bacterium]HAZ02967.1 Na+-transporting NADH:ubiquinone oxidoreductase subunit D [Marinilabiliales bacterium]HBX83317.1 Na+-transporting NADH:ubiquinone oxidoreductase subunit D [Marinilabiliales bacterium]HCC29343.1 Na+-transporting NADH:ubiquinone oxidoreductase subunit D [Marinilabiliales bacterium]
MNQQIHVSPSPHINGEFSVPKIMYGVVLALLPAFAASVYYFGMGAIIVTAVSVLSCVAFEYLIHRFILKIQPRITDGSAVLTGLLLAFNVPSNLPILVIVIGALVAIGIGKMSFGGLGQNPFNPALVGRVFLLISFPVQMTSWPTPGGFSTGYADAVTGATPLALVKEAVKNGESISTLANIPSHMQLFFGHMGGSMGEVSALALLLGFAFLLYRKIITWHIPVFLIGTVFAFSGILHLASPEKFADPVFHILTGGIMLGAVFMATDYVTSPMTHFGMIIFAIGIGLLTVIIRNFGAYPEGISFAILIMNALVPLLNRWTKPTTFGEEVKNGN